MLDDDLEDDAAAHEQRDEDGREEEGLGADALEVLALCDEPDVMHRHCLQLFSMKISSSVGSMTSKRVMRVPRWMASASSGWASDRPSRCGA